MNCIPIGCLFFPLAVQSRRHVAPLSNPIKAEVAKPHAPRVRRGGAWDVIEPLRNRAINAVLNCLPRSFSEKKVAGHMDALIDAMANAKDPKGVKALEKMIVDIATLSSGLDCMEIYHEQIRAKVRTLNHDQFSSCSKIIRDCVNAHSDNQYLKMMEGHFSVCEDGNNRIRAYFDKIFEIKLNPDMGEFFRAIKLLSLPAQRLGFPEECASVESLARDVVKNMSEKELAYLKQINVVAYEGWHKEWAEICSRTAKEEGINREKAEICSRTAKEEGINREKAEICSRTAKEEGINREKAVFVQKFEMRVRGIARQIKDSLDMAQLAMHADNKKGYSNLGSLVMALARDINVLQLSGKDVIRDALGSILCKDDNLKLILKGAKNYKTKTVFIDMEEKITNGIDELCRSQYQRNRKEFDFNPKKNCDPVSPKELVNMLFDLALQ